MPRKIRQLISDLQGPAFSSTARKVPTASSSIPIFRASLPSAEPRALTPRFTRNDCHGDREEDTYAELCGIVRDEIMSGIQS
jgi:hypothetical protein